MPVEMEMGFQDPGITQSFLTQAAATQEGRYTVQQDYDPEIEDILRKETMMWQLITSKKPANAAIVRKIKKANRPTIGFVNRGDLSGVYDNPNLPPSKDLSDPGQEVKALAGSIQFEHFGRSLADQQGRPYGDEVAEETNDMLINAARFLEMSLFTGDADAAGGLEFNGIDKQTPTSPSNNHVFTANITTATPDSIVDKLNEIVVRATNDRNVLRRITHIFCTGAASLKIRDEVGQQHLYENRQEINAGIRVPGIVTPNGILPIITSPYINDLDGGAGNDVCRFYLIDIDSLEWRGVYPFGGVKTFQPQLFDITNTINGLPLVEKRMCLMYGTLYAKNGGEGIYRLDVTVPPGSVWNTSSEVIR